MTQNAKRDAIQAVFIDRDGTIGGTGRFIHPDDFKPYSFVPEALRLLKEHGILILACTNQNHISDGRATEDDFRREFARLGFDDAYICPHPADSDCDCRKPATGLLTRAATVGATKVLVRTGWGETSLGEYRHTWKGIEPDQIADDLLDAAKWVVGQDQVPRCEESSTPTNALVACLKDGSVLLVQRSLEESAYPGHWEFPGGNIEPGETPVEAAVREFREECGCDITVENEVARFSWEAGGRCKTEVIFAGNPTGPIRLDNDHCDYAWANSVDLAEDGFRCSAEVRSVALVLCRRTARAPRRGRALG